MDFMTLFVKCKLRFGIINCRAFKHDIFCDYLQIRMSIASRARARVYRQIHFIVRARLNDKPNIHYNEPPAATSRARF